ncbi:MAG: kelch repeat-containing protein [Planctomycetaceae bacterium]
MDPRIRTWLIAIVAALVVMSVASPSRAQPGSSVFGEGGEWDQAFAARQLEKFRAIEPDPRVLAQIEALGDDSWLALDPAGDEAPESGRGEVPMVYMPDFKACAFICGCTEPGYSSDVWFYVPAANRWVQMWPNWIKGSRARQLNRGPYPEDRPAGRCSLGLAYDSDEKLLINHGGANAGNFGLQTFELDVAKNSWMRATGLNDPHPLAGGDNCLGFAPGFGVVQVVRGGRMRTEGSVRMYDAAETWRYDASENRWERLPVKNQAPGAHNANLVWNSRDERLVYHTGAELWTFDPATLAWENLTPERKGPPRYRHGNAYDPFNNVLITYGGKDESSLWVFDFASRAWSEMKSPDRPARSGQKMLMCFDTDSNVCVMKHGGKVLFYRYKRAANGK